MADEKTYTQADIDAAVEKASAKVQESIDRLEAKNKELVGELRQARKAGEIKPEDMEKVESERDKALADLAAAHKAAKEATAAAEKATKALETETAFTQRLLIQDGIKTHLIENGVKDADFIDSLTAKFAGQAKVVTEGEERKALIGDKPLPDYIKEWAGSDVGKKFVAAPANSGGGAGGGGGNGATVKTMTRTEYNERVVSDPAGTNAFIKGGGKIVDQVTG